MLAFQGSLAYIFTSSKHITQKISKNIKLLRYYKALVALVSPRSHIQVFLGTLTLTTAWELNVVHGESRCGYICPPTEG